MAEEYQRADRVGEQLQRELSDLIRRELRDPKLNLLTVTAVQVASDMGHARVYVHSLDPQADGEAIAQSLNKAGGYLRSLLGKRLRLRTTPILDFQYDSALENAERMSDLIAQARRHDASGPGENADQNADDNSDQNADTDNPAAEKPHDGA